MDVPPNQTIYLQNLNEKLPKEGKQMAAGQLAQGARGAGACHRGQECLVAMRHSLKRKYYGMIYFEACSSCYHECVMHTMRLQESQH